MKKLKILITILFLHSCASRIDDIPEDIEQKDLTDTFEISKEQIVQFKVEHNEEIVKDVEKKVVVQKKEVKKEKKVAAKKAVAPSEIVPDDYPEIYKQYDEKSSKIWAQFKPVFSPGEKFYFSVEYLGLNVGDIEIMLNDHAVINAQNVFHLKARMRSASYYEYIYTLDDVINSYLETEKFMPVKYSLVQRESGQSVDDLQLFDFKKKKTYSYYKRLKKGELKKFELSTYTPSYFQDSFSALYFVRGLPLKIGDKYEFPVITRGKLWLINIDVVEEEKINVANAEYSAMKIKAETHFPGVLKKSGDIIFWYSSDPSHKLLKFSAKVKIGSISGELKKYVPSGEKVD